MRPPRPRWTAEQVRALGVRTSVEVAGEVLGLSRSAAYAAVNRGDFPVPVIKVSARRWVVPVAGLLRALGLDVDEGRGAAPAQGVRRTAPSANREAIRRAWLEKQREGAGKPDPRTPNS